MVRQHCIVLFFFFTPAPSFAGNACPIDQFLLEEECWEYALFKNASNEASGQKTCEKWPFKGSTYTTGCYTYSTGKYEDCYFFGSSPNIGSNSKKTGVCQTDYSRVFALPQPQPTTTTSQTTPQQCGASPDRNSRDLVVSGWAADRNEWPWMAALLHNGIQFCGGSLITPRIVLTAAQCVANMTRYDVANLRVRLGAHYIKQKESGVHESRAGRVVRPKEFNPKNLDWDVALIYLDIAVPANHDTVRPVCLPSGNQQYIGEEATVVGWGSLWENGPPADELMEVTVGIWDNAECKDTYGGGGFDDFVLHKVCDSDWCSDLYGPGKIGTITSRHLCAGSAGRDSCSGDTGGPMVVKRGSTWTQIGIVSWGAACGKSHFPGVYTRVTAVKDWIDNFV